MGSQTRMTSQRVARPEHLPDLGRGILQIPEDERLLRARLHARGRLSHRQAFLAEGALLDDPFRARGIVRVHLADAGTVDAASTTEDNSFGLNEVLLRRIAEESGGEYDPKPGTPLFARSTSRQPLAPLWPWLLVAGACSYLVAIALQRTGGGR